MSTEVGMSSCCLSGKLHNHATPVGSVTEIGAVKTYVREPESKSKSQTLVFLVDVFGYELSNTRLLADGKLSWMMTAMLIYNRICKSWVLRSCSGYPSRRSIGYFFPSEC